MKQPTQRSVLGKMATYLQLALLLFTSHFASGDASYRSEKAPSSSLFVAGEGMSCSYINASGQRAFLATFDDCLDFSDGYAPVQINKKWGFINGGGQLEVRPRFDECRWSFSEGLAAVRSGKYWGYIDVKAILSFRRDLNTLKAFLKVLPWSWLMVSMALSTRQKSC